MLGTIWQQHWLRMQQITLLDPQVFLQYNGHMDMIQELERRNDPLEANGERVFGSKHFQEFEYAAACR